MNLPKSILIPVLFLVGIIGCQKNQSPLESTAEKIAPAELVYSKSDSIEAQGFALWLSGKLRPADDLVSVLLYNLNYLRFKYEEEYPIVNKDNRFLTPWAIGQISCKVDSPTAIAIKNNQYGGWNQLPSSLRPARIISDPDQLGWCLIGFDEMYHPRRLDELYSALPGFLVCEPNGYGFTGLSGFSFFPRLIKGAMSYLYPAPPGITGSYLFFKYVDNEPQFIGRWNPENEPEPEWWAEASPNIEQFTGWDGESAVEGGL